MAFKLNPFTGNFDLVNAPDGAGPVFNEKFKFHYASLSSYDKIVAISYLDAGTKNERIGSVVYSSVLYPDADLTKTVYWLDVGTMNQRIEKEEYVGAVLATDSIRKTYNYVLADIRYRRSGYQIELF